VQPAQTYKAGEYPLRPADWPRRRRRAATVLGCAIAQPTDDQTFTSVDSLSIIVRTDPGYGPETRSSSYSTGSRSTAGRLRAASSPSPRWIAARTPAGGGARQRRRGQVPEPGVTYNRHGSRS